VPIGAFRSNSRQNARERPAQVGQGRVHYATCVYYAISVDLWPVEFFEAPAFTRYVDRYLDHEEFRGKRAP